MPAKKPNTDPRIDAYIEKSAPFAQPILKHIRTIVHSACPQVVETIKWGMPHFDYQGIMCGMSAFKTHCSFSFWKGELIVDPKANRNNEGMGQFGRITSIKDLPPKSRIVTYIKAAMKLNEQGAKAPHMANRKQRAPLPMPKVLATALKANKKAGETFANLSPSQRRDYIEWIVEAKTEATVQKRLATTLEWLAEGKSRNWKYMKK